MKTTTKVHLNSTVGSDIDNVSLAEIESKHNKKLHALEIEYLDHLKHQKDEIARRLHGDLTDNARQLLITYQREIENEILEFRFTDPGPI